MAVDVFAVPALADAIAVLLGHGAPFRRRGVTVLEAPDRAGVGDVCGPTLGILNAACLKPRLEIELGREGARCRLVP